MRRLPSISSLLISLGHLLRIEPGSHCPLARIGRSDGAIFDRADIHVVPERWG